MHERRCCSVSVHTELRWPSASSRFNQGATVYGSKDAATDHAAQEVNDGSRLLQGCCTFRLST